MNVSLNQHSIVKRSNSVSLVSGVVSSRVWARIPVKTLLPLSMALNYKCFVKKVGKEVHSALAAKLLVDDTHAYILTDSDGGG